VNASNVCIKGYDLGGIEVCPSRVKGLSYGFWFDPDVRSRSYFQCDAQGDLEEEIERHVRVVVEPRWS